MSKFQTCTNIKIFYNICYSFVDELDIIKSYRMFFQQSAEQGDYAINHTIPYDKEILTEFLDYRN